MNLKHEYESKLEEKQIVCSKIADNFVQQGYSLHHNIIDHISKTSVNISSNQLKTSKDVLMFALQENSQTSVV